MTARAFSLSQLAAEPKQTFEWMPLSDIRQIEWDKVNEIMLYMLGEAWQLEQAGQPISIRDQEAVGQAKLYLFGTLTNDETPVTDQAV